MRANAQELLEALARQTEPARPLELRQPLGINESNAHRALQALAGRGLAARPRPGLYRITDRGRAFLAAGRAVNSAPRNDRPPSPRKGTIRGRTWQAARMVRRFTIEELAPLAAQPGQDVRGSVHRYVKALERAGYLRPLRSGSYGTRRWLLVYDTGPRHPLLLKRESEVYDPNTGRTHEVRRSA